MRGIDTVFTALLDMSIRAGWLMLAVIVLRLVVRNAPGWMRCVLWAFVALRLTCPFSVPSAFSLVPDAQTVRTDDAASAPVPEGSTGIRAADDAAGPAAPESLTHSPDSRKENSRSIPTACLSILWLSGLVLFIGYALFGSVRLRRNVSEAAKLRDNIYLCDRIRSPFIYGLIRPAVYLPTGLDADAMQYVLAHEQAHLARRDHWWKAISFLLLAVYWFHPLVWVSCVLFGRDLELACDEKAVRHWTLEKRKSYSHALVSCSTKKNAAFVCPLAFGEVGVKERVKAVLRYKKPTAGVTAASIIVCAVVAVCFLTSPAKAAPPPRADQTAHTAHDGNSSAARTPDTSGLTAQAQPSNKESDESATQPAGAGCPAYDTVLAKAAYALKHPHMDLDSENELISPEFFQTQEGRMTLGYLLQDIDGDGTKELLLGANSDIEDGWDGIIWNMFTVSGNAPVKVFEGWMNNTWYLCEDGVILNNAYSGSYNNYDYYDYNNGALTLLESVFFDGHDGENPSWSYNTTTNSEASVSISEKEAGDIIKKHAIAHTQFIPF